MDRRDLAELHYITHINNLALIIRHGILSHNRAKKYNPTSVANPDVQDRRKVKSVPGGMALHDYANLYVNARNAMLFGILGFPGAVPKEHMSICVLSISTEVLDTPGVVISDRNAAATFSRFYPSPAGLQSLDKDTVFARYWKDLDQSQADPIEETRRRECMMAEVLVPGQVDKRYLTQAYVCCNGAQQKAQGLGSGITIVVNKYLFFNDGGRQHD